MPILPHTKDHRISQYYRFKERMSLLEPIQSRRQQHSLAGQTTKRLLSLTGMSIAISVCVFSFQQRGKQKKHFHLLLSGNKRERRESTERARSNKFSLRCSQSMFWFECKLYTGKDE